MDLGYFIHKNLELVKSIIQQNLYLLFHLVGLRVIKATRFKLQSYPDTFSKAADHMNL